MWGWYAIPIKIVGNQPHAGAAFVEKKDEPYCMRLRLVDCNTSIFFPVPE
jgi:hypothetical protein